MGNADLRRMRIWLICLLSVYILILTGSYSYFTYLHKDEKYQWMTSKDWTLIVFSVVLYVAYIYSFYGTRVLEKHMRVFWMLIPCLTIMGITFDNIHHEILYSRTSYRGDPPFECDYAECRLNWLVIFVGAIAGLFSLIEIGMGYAWGPLQPKSQYGSFGYNTNAQVIVVSPEQPQSQQMMQTVYPPQPQNLYYQPLLPQQQQQGSHLVSPLPLSGAEGVSSAQGVVAQPYQQTEQQHQYRSFAQPAPFLQQQSVAGSPSPQPSPGATASSVGTQQYSPAAVPSHTPAST